MGSIFKPKMPRCRHRHHLPDHRQHRIAGRRKRKELQEQDAMRRKRKGRKSTILTGPLGIQETEEEALETLLGK